MIRKLLRRLLGPPTGDIYIVIDTGRLAGHIAGVSTKLQGAERIRADYADRQSAAQPYMWQHIYDRTIIENHELQDGDQ